MQIVAATKIDQATQKPNDILKAILLSRGVVNEEDIASFLDPKLPPLSQLIKDLGLDSTSLAHAKQLVHDAINAGKNICVYGDYDADGISATAIMWLTLTKMGAKALPFIPNRTRHGYGLSDASVKELLAGTGFGNYQGSFVPDLIITVDNGIVANSQIQLLKEQKIAVIVTDHHQRGPTLPECDAIIHTTQTSGAGIAWIFARYLSEDAFFAKARIDLATIGIVADQMPVLAPNRSIIKEGLKAIQNTDLLGLRTILQLAGITNKPLTTYDINFILGPRINAVGRIDDALAALRLLCTNNQKLAYDLSLYMETLNKKRQAMTDIAIKDALSHLTNDKITVIASDTYHHGVVGLIASKIAEESHKPAVVMSIDGDLVRGSARSIAGINITSLLRAHKDLLISVGGHEQAAGFSLARQNLADFTAALVASANANIDDKLLENFIYVDAELPLSTTSLDLAETLAALEPYGIGNPKPRFVSYNLHVLGDQLLGEAGKHHKLTVALDGETRTVLWFNGKSVSEVISRLVYTLDIHTWRNQKELQLLSSYVEFA